MLYNKLQSQNTEIEALLSNLLNSKESDSDLVNFSDKQFLTPRRRKLGLISFLNLPSTRQELGNQLALIVKTEILPPNHSLRIKDFERQKETILIEEVKIEVVILKIKQISKTTVVLVSVICILTSAVAGTMLWNMIIPMEFGVSVEFGLELQDEYGTPIAQIDWGYLERHETVTKNFILQSRCNKQQNVTLILPETTAYYSFTTTFVNCTLEKEGVAGDSVSFSISLTDLDMTSDGQYTANIEFQVVDQFPPEASENIEFEATGVSYAHETSNYLEYISDYFDKTVYSVGEQINWNFTTRIIWADGVNGWSYNLNLTKAGSTIQVLRDTYTISGFMANGYEHTEYITFSISEAGIYKLELEYWLADPVVPPPPPELELFDHYNTGRDGEFNIYSIERVGQTFQPVTSFEISKIKLMFAQPGAFVGVLRVSIQSVNVDGEPDGTELTYGEFDLRFLDLSSTIQWWEIDFHATITLTAEADYAVVLQATNVEIHEQICVGTDITSPTYTRGYSLYSEDGATWTIHEEIDVMFELWGFPV